MPAFNIDTDWEIVQSNGPIVTIHLHRIPNAPSTGWQFDGQAEYGSVRSRTDVPGVRARTEGDGPGSTITILIQWSDGNVGEYHGTFSPFLPGEGSRLTGNTFDVRNPNSQATWRSTGFFHYV